jgi:hypothetical protein
MTPSIVAGKVCQGQHSSLLQKFANCGQKSFITLAPGLVFSSCLAHKHRLKLIFSAKRSSLRQVRWDEKKFRMTDQARNEACLLTKRTETFGR